MVGDLLQCESSIEELACTGMTKAMGAPPGELRALLGQQRPHHIGDSRTRQRADWCLDRQEQRPMWAPRTCLTKITHARLANGYRHWRPFASSHLCYLDI